MLRAVLAGLAIAAACSSPGDPVARSVAATVERELGVRPRAVRCQRAACTVSLPGDLTLAVTVDGDRAVAWESAELLDPRPIVAQITGELAALGAPQAVDCGPLRIAPAAPVTIECRLGDGGAAWATIDLSGTVDLEVALTAAIADARRSGPDDAALDALSRALDSDEAEGTHDDPVGDDEVDAAVSRGPGG